MRSGGLKKEWRRRSEEVAALFWRTTFRCDLAGGNWMGRTEEWLRAVRERRERSERPMSRAGSAGR